MKLSNLIPGTLVLVGMLFPISWGLSKLDSRNLSESSKLAYSDKAPLKAVPKVVNPLGINYTVNFEPIKTTITLESRNTLVLRGPVTQESISKLMLQLKNMSKVIPKDGEIFLVLDTPGGSVFAGINFIDFANALPQKINTITLFAASMGFQIAQNMDKRYIIRGGTLMSHRAAVGGMAGQIKGEFEARYRMVRRAVDFLDQKASSRMGLSIPEYDALVVNEYWVHGFDAVAEKAADEQVLVICGDSLNGVVSEEIHTMFGVAVLEFSECPLIRGPLSVDTSELFEKRTEMEEIITMSYKDKTRFVMEYITTNKFYDYFSTKVKK